MLPKLLHSKTKWRPSHDDQLSLYIDNNPHALANVIHFVGQLDSNNGYYANVDLFRQHCYRTYGGPSHAASRYGDKDSAQWIETELQELLDTKRPYFRSYLHWEMLLQHYQGKIQDGCLMKEFLPEAIEKAKEAAKQESEAAVIKAKKTNGKRKLNDAIIKAFDGILFDTVGCLAILPTQMERELYLAVKDVMEDYGGKYQTNQSAFKFPDKGSMIRMQTEVAGGESHNQKSKHQAFYTPPAVVNEMMKLAQVKRLEIALEPSAGYGAIARALRDAGAIVSCVEMSYDAAEYLRKDGFPTKHCNFLTLWPYDFMTKPSVIVMNPPFTQAQDATHVQRAWMLLKPGGRLVSVVSKTAETNSRKEYRELRKLVDEHGEFVDLRAGSFRESGTSVSTSLVVLRKPKTWSDPATSSESSPVQSQPSSPRSSPPAKRSTRSTASGRSGRKKATASSSS